jgi:hypothetical protein
MQMHPYISEAIARQQIADWQSAAATSAWAGTTDGLRPRRRRLNWPLFGRRYRRVELVWPDGVSSVVAVADPRAAGDDRARGLTGTRR